MCHCSEGSRAGAQSAKTANEAWQDWCLHQQLSCQQRQHDHRYRFAVDVGFPTQERGREEVQHNRNSDRHCTHQDRHPSAVNHHCRQPNPQDIRGPHPQTPQLEEEAGADVQHILVQLIFVNNVAGAGYKLPRPLPHRKQFSQHNTADKDHGKSAHRQTQQHRHGRVQGGEGQQKEGRVCGTAVQANQRDTPPVDHNHTECHYIYGQTHQTHYGTEHNT
mmetsp:Transcript_32774/g.64230  ORF Transcript_32774/g.64230 Transcript_32774/m.64230 type:complete len:219 (+) Transcript_32774:115-771(+)